MKYVAIFNFALLATSMQYASFQNVTVKAYPTYGTTRPICIRRADGKLQKVYPTYTRGIVSKTYPWQLEPSSIRQTLPTGPRLKNNPAVTAQIAYERKLLTAFLLEQIEKNEDWHRKNLEGAYQLSRGFLPNFAQFIASSKKSIQAKKELPSIDFA